ncbi:MAG: formylglycine-generating enzyme family protein [Candidatus Hatepunaea meridiana]|nr:formylglycine-generating enzyme family protein [Candidatus Hatepunaea meridiana]
MKKYIIITILFLQLPAYAASIDNVRFSITEDDRIIITYDISGSGSYEVTLSVSTDGGKNFFIKPRSLSGDVGEKISAGRNKRIEWDVFRDMKRLQGEVAFLVTAKPVGGFAKREKAKRSVIASEAKQSLSGPLSGMVFVKIPAGTFTMGSPSNEKDRLDREGPQHRVTIKSFYMQTTEVTQKQWREVMGTTVRRQRDKANRHWPMRGEGDNNPIYYVPWNEAKEFIKKLNKMYPGKSYRLPSEAEWEYACRAGTTTPFNTGSTISTDQANYDGNYTYGNGRKGVYRKKTVSVGSFAPNSWSLYDMHGNVWEWCEDWYHDSYRSAPDNGSAWVSPSGSSRVLRGGSWARDPRYCRSAYRRFVYPDNRNDLYGFRLCYSAFSSSP